VLGAGKEQEVPEKKRVTSYYQGIK